MARLFAGTPFDIPPTCDRCGQVEEDCQCPPLPSPSVPRILPDQQTAHVRCEKRTKGKVVTVIRGLTAAGNDLPALLKKLKSDCGAGGTVREDELEIQGDHVVRVIEALRRIGYRTK